MEAGLNINMPWSRIFPTHGLASRGRRPMLGLRLQDAKPCCRENVVSCQPVK